MPKPSGLKSLIYTHFLGPQRLHLGILVLVLGTFIRCGYAEPSSGTPPQEGHTGSEPTSEGTALSHPNPRGEGHEASEHATRHLDNWFSLNFGPGKAHNNGPLAFALLNFVILLWLVRKFSRQPFRDYLHHRRATIQHDLEEAATLHQQAQQKLAAIDMQLKNIEAEMTRIKENVTKDAELEKANIIKSAEAEAARIIGQAEQKLQREFRLIQRRLEVEAVSTAMSAAEKLIKQNINEDDRKKINEDYFVQITSSGGTN